MLNLDFLCMKTAQQMMACQGTAGDKENVATAGLGILLENGPYGLSRLGRPLLDRHCGRYKEQLVAVCRESHRIHLAGCSDDGNFQAVSRGCVVPRTGRYLFQNAMQHTVTMPYHAKRWE